MERIKKNSLPVFDYSDTLSALCVLLGSNGVEYIDYYVVARLYELSGEENPYRSLN